MTPRDRLDAYASLGLDLYLDGDDNLRLRGPRGLRDAARPAILAHKAELVDELRRLRDDAARRLIAATVSHQQRTSHHRSEEGS
jgi:hypothetical protein